MTTSLSPSSPWSTRGTAASFQVDIEVSEGETVSTGAPIGFNDTCTVAELGDPPGAVIYTCEATVDSTCVDDQTVAFDVSDAGGVGSVTITNAYLFEPRPESSQPGAVAAQPAFTG